MTWSLSASGHTPTPDGEESWESVEQELHERLQEVLADPKFGATSSSLSGNHVHTEPHKPHPAHGAHAPE
jgi:hypothetical protein